MHLIAPLLEVAMDNRSAVSRHRHLENEHKTTEQHGLVFFFVFLCILYVCAKEGVTAEIMMCDVYSSVILFVFVFQCVYSLVPDLVDMKRDSLCTTKYSHLYWSMNFLSLPLGIGYCKMYCEILSCEIAYSCSVLSVATYLQIYLCDQLSKWQSLSW